MSDNTGSIWSFAILIGVIVIVLAGAAYYYLARAGVEFAGMATVADSGFSPQEHPLWMIGLLLVIILGMFIYAGSAQKRISGFM
jgi:hypothetical protein